MLTLLMTRPQEASQRFVDLLSPQIQNRVSVVYSPLIEIVQTADDIVFEDAGGLIFTSSNGVAVAARLTARRDLPCFCVGEATTNAARHAGWRADCVGPNSSVLIETLSKTQLKTPQLHIRGTHSRGDIAAGLTALGCPTRAQVVYDQRLLPFTASAERALMAGGAVIAPVFSPRTARQFANLHAGAAPLYLAALSPAVKKPLETLDYRELMVSEHPDSMAMAQTVEQLVILADRVEGNGPAQ